MNIIKTVPFSFIEFHKLTVERSVNCHSVLHVQGLIKKDSEQEYINYCVSNEYPQFQVLIEDDSAEDEPVFFDGLITQFSIKREGGVCLLSLEAKSGTCRMDKVKHIRFYQDKEQSCHDILKEICDTYPYCNYIIEDKEINTLNRFTIQYLETDWQFLKRLASRYYSALIPADHVPGIHFFMGNPRLNMHEVSENEYTLVNKVQDFHCMKDVMPMGQYDFQTYCFTGRKFYRLGDPVVFNGLDLCVYQVKSELLHGEMLHNYVLSTKNSFRTPNQENPALIGASFDAVITEVIKDKVKIELNHGENTSQTPSMEFPFSTVYSSADGTGWYCMPEKGDTVRLYLPTQHESDAYVTSAVHQPSSDQTARTNPDIKSLKTRYGKELYFAPDSIVLTNHKGDKITLHDEQGISIESSKNLIMKARGDISITTGQTLTMNAADQIDLGQGGSRLVIDDDIAFKGGKLRME